MLSYFESSFKAQYFLFFFLVMIVFVQWKTAAECPTLNLTCEPVVISKYNLHCYSYAVLKKEKKKTLEALTKDHP